MIIILFIIILVLLEFIDGGFVSIWDKLRNKKH